MLYSYIARNVAINNIRVLIVVETLMKFYMVLFIMKATFFITYVFKKYPLIINMNTTWLLTKAVSISLSMSSFTVALETKLNTTVIKTNPNMILLKIMVNKQRQNFYRKYELEIEIKILENGTTLQGGGSWPRNGKNMVWCCFS